MPTVTRDFGTIPSWSPTDFSTTDFGPPWGGVNADFKATVVRDFGDLPSWSPVDFSPVDFGPPAPGITEFGSSIVRNNVTVVEYEGNVARDSSVPEASALNPRRDFVVPQETGAVASLIANATVPIEWLKGLSGVMTSIPVEWRVTVFRDSVVPSEWRTAFTIDAAMFAEMLSLRAIAVPASADFKLTAVAVFPTSAEWRTPVAKDSVFPTESTLSVRVDEVVPWSLTGSVQRDDATPLQFLPTILRDDQITFESGLVPVAASSDARVAIDWSGGISADRSAQIESRSTPFRDTIVFSEWTGGAASFDDAVLSIEFGAGAFATAATVPSESVSGVLSAPEFGAISDASAIAELTPVSEYTLSVLGENFLFPAANESLLVTDYATPIEWSSLFVTADATFFAGWTQSLASDFAAPISWTATISVDTQMLIETLTTPVVFHSDAEMQVEWTMPVMVDVVISGDRWFSRESIGSSLEPDDWEADHGS